MVLKTISLGAVQVAVYERLMNDNLIIFVINAAGIRTVGVRSGWS